MFEFQKDRSVWAQVAIGLLLSILAIGFVELSWPWISHSPYSVLVLPIVGSYLIGGSALSGTLTTLILMIFALKFTNKTGLIPYSFFFATGLLVAYLIKITKARIRALSSAEIREEESERLKFAASAGKLGIWEWDIQNDQLVWDSQMFDFYGVEREAFTGSVIEWEKSLHPEDLPRAKEILQESLKAKPRFKAEFRILRPGGETRYIQAEGLLIRDKLGNPLKMFGLNRDVTEEKRNLQKIQELLAYLETALEQSQAGIVIVEATNGEIKFANQAALNITGRPKTDVVDNIDINKYPVWGVADLDGNPLEGKDFPISRAMRDGHLIKEELLMVRPSGEKRTILANAAPIRSTGGEIIAGIVVFLDITEQHQLLETVKAAQKEAEEAMEAKSRFLDVAAHELRTPVTAVSLMLQLAQRQMTCGLSFDFSSLDRMKIQIDRLHRLVVDLLEVSKLDRGVLELKYEWSDFGDLIKDCVSIFKIQFPERTIQFSAPSNPVELNLDTVRIYEVVTNLIDNAIKYTPENSPIEIHLESNPEQVYFAITDHGLGLSENVRKRLFGAFERENSDKQKRYSGLGLGLFISRGIVELHGGKIGFQSQEGKGSTFFFSLPRIPGLAKTGTTSS